MSSLFSASTAKRARKRRRDDAAAPAAAAPAAPAAAAAAALPVVPALNRDARTLADLGVASWLVEACRALEVVKPTPVQRACIPAALAGRDVLGLAPTGSGKTAAFALPVLQKLLEDPVGIYCIVLEPSRELAAQVAEQFAAFGAPANVRVETVIGGVDGTKQGLALARRPHVVVATPGRLAEHVRGASPPSLAAVRWVVLDEADRLLLPGFAPDLATIMQACPTERRQTLLFSATMTASIEAVKSVAASDPLVFDLTGGAASAAAASAAGADPAAASAGKAITLPATLKQEYLLMPSQVKMCYLLQLVLTSVATAAGGGGGGGGAAASAAFADGDDGGGGGGGDGETDARARTAIVFASSCRRCAELAQVLLEVGVTDCVALHSATTQGRRLAALGKFRSAQATVLVCTDVGARGLDLPRVDLVVNYDAPRTPADYAHRVGRTARAGRAGRAVTLVTPRDVALVHAVEDATGTKLAACKGVDEDDCLRLLNPVTKALRRAKRRLQELGFDQDMERQRARKANFKKERRAAV